MCCNLSKYLYPKKASHFCTVSRSAFKMLTGKPTGKRPLGKPRHRWEDNIRMDLEEESG